MINKQRLFCKFCNYVEVNSESGNEKAIRNKLLQDVKELGFTAKTDDIGEKCASTANNIYAFLKGDNTKKSRFIVCHMDTVSSGGAINSIMDGEYIISDGTTILSADDKSAIAAFLEAVRCLKENNISHRTIEVVFTIGEEQGLIGAKNFDISKSPNYIVSHSPYKTTANIGYVCGGTGSNVVMSELIAKCEVRSIDKEKHDKQLEHMIETFKNTATQLGGSAKIKITNKYPGYKINKDSENLKIVSEIISSMGKEVKFISSGGGSDANIFISKGFDVLNIGTGMENIHSNQERININDFIFMSELIYNYFK